jgi:hypothetical protein
VLPVSISQVKDLREKLRCVQLLTIATVRCGEVRMVHSGLALRWLRKELYWATVEGVYRYDRSELRVSAEGYSRITSSVLNLKSSGAVARRGGENFLLVLKQARLS